MISKRVNRKRNSRENTWRIKEKLQKKNMKYVGNRSKIQKKQEAEYDQ